jgi:hypothetical protein
MFRAFRDIYRRRVEHDPKRGWAEGWMATGWNWLRQRLAQDELGAEHLPRCHAVVDKLSKKKWVFLYECIALVMLERMESINERLIRQHRLHALEPHASLRCVQRVFVLMYFGTRENLCLVTSQSPAYRAQRPTYFIRFCLP